MSRRPSADYRCAARQVHRPQRRSGLSADAETLLASFGSTVDSPDDPLSRSVRRTCELTLRRSCSLTSSSYRCRLKFGRSSCYRRSRGEPALRAESCPSHEASSPSRFACGVSLPQSSETRVGDQSSRPESYTPHPMSSMWGTPTAGSAQAAPVGFVTTTNVCAVCGDETLSKRLDEAPIWKIGGQDFGGCSGIPARQGCSSRWNVAVGESGCAARER